MIQDHTDHGTPKEIKNPYPEWIHVLEFSVSVRP